MVCIHWNQDKQTQMYNRIEVFAQFAVPVRLVNCLVSPNHNCYVLGSNGVLQHKLLSAQCGSHADDTLGVLRMCRERDTPVD